MKRGRSGWWLVAALIASRVSAALAGEAPANVILMIGDGMGPAHIRAAGLFANGKEGSLFMETLPRRAEVVTCPAYSVPAGDEETPAKVTDSAAAATAMATGQKVYNGVLSVALPGDGRPLATVLEQAASAGKRTGLVTTSYLTDATPAAFGAHVKARTLHSQIATDYLKTSRPNLLLGGANKGSDFPLAAAAAPAAGYAVVTNRAGLLALALAGGGPDHVLGLFGYGPMCYEYDYASKERKDYDVLPHLSEMTDAALDLLGREPKGFFVMIEGACIDKAAHGNNIERAVYETLEFDKAVQHAARWAAGHTNTLLLVTADHETGSLGIIKDNDKGVMPEVTWASRGHSGANVRLFAVGPGSEGIAGTLDNTDVARLAQGAFTGPTRYTPPRGDGADGADEGMKGD